MSNDRYTSQHSIFAGQGFSKSGEITISGIWREAPELGQAFTMLTMEPGPDIAP